MLGMNAVTIMIGFVVGAAFIGFICTRLICYKLRHIEAEHVLQIDPQLPVHKINVDAIPTLKFNHEAFVSIEDPLCAICLGEYEEKQTLRIMPKCGHSFHLPCIDEWLGQHMSCPICRLSVHKDSVDPKHVSTVVMSASQSFSTTSEIPVNIACEGGRI